MTKKIVIVHPRAEHYAGGLRVACPEADIVAVTEERLGMREPPPEAYDHFGEADAIVSIARWIKPEIVDSCDRLKWFQCLITGTDHIAPLLSGRDVILTNARGIHGPQMSELAILNMLVYMRQVARLMHNKDTHTWERIPARILRRRTVVILGVGMIAEHLAKLCKAFDMHTIGVSRTVREVEGFDQVVARGDMLTAVGEADFVVVLMPLTDENRHAVDARVLGSMRPDAALINIARGGVVDEDALIEALRSGAIAFAGLDVFQTSPLPADSPLWDMDNVFITPMIGGQSDQYDDDALPIVATNLKSFLAGRPGDMINRVEL